MTALPPVICPYCWVRRTEQCVTASGEPRPPHQRRIALAAAPPPHDHVWQGFSYRIYCPTCGIPASVDTMKIIIAHPSRQGTEWCLSSHMPDVNGRKVP